MDEHLEVGIAGATQKQLLRAILRETRKNTKAVQALTVAVQEGNQKMTDLTGSVDALQVAVQEVRDRVTGSLTPLQEALAAAQQTIADERAADATEDADYEAKVAARDEALAALSTKVDEAVSEIDQATADLNKIAQPEPDPNA